MNYELRKIHWLLDRGISFRDNRGIIQYEFKRGTFVDNGLLELAGTFGSREEAEAAKVVLERLEFRKWFTRLQDLEKPKHIIGDHERILRFFVDRFGVGKHLLVERPELLPDLDDLRIRPSDEDLEDLRTLVGVEFLRIVEFPSLVDSLARFVRRAIRWDKSASNPTDPDRVNVAMSHWESRSPLDHLYFTSEPPSLENLKAESLLLCQLPRRGPFCTSRRQIDRFLQARFSLADELPPERAISINGTSFEPSVFIISAERGRHDAWTVRSVIWGEGHKNSSTCNLDFDVSRVGMGTEEWVYNAYLASISDWLKKHGDSDLLPKH